MEKNLEKVANSGSGTADTLSIKEVAIESKNASLEDCETTEQPQDDSSTECVSMAARLKARYPWWKLAVHVFVGCFFTSWWISILAQERHRPQWLIPTVLWGMLMVRLVTLHLRIVYILFGYVQRAWAFCVERLYRWVPQRSHRLAAAALVTVAVILVGTFVPEETPDLRREDRAIAFAGLIVCVGALYATLHARRRIQWRTVIGGILMQYIVALFVLKTKCGYDVFNFISTLARELLGFLKDGVAFLTNAKVLQYGMFFFTVLPAVAFFVAFIHILYYYGIMQWLIRKVATFFFWALRVTGAEAVTASGSPFLGIGESLVLAKSFMSYLTRAEIHQVMTSGFSTILGSVLVGYIGLGLNPQAMVSSCVMLIPASLAISKLRYPETEITVTSSRVDVCDIDDEETRPRNVLQAFANGATLGLRIAGLMLIQCMCIIALVALANGILTWFGKFWNILHLTLELILGYIFYPLSFFLGTPRNEILSVARLMATKVVQNEYNAYTLMLNEEPYKLMSKRGTIIATYALCGFSNLGLMGIQIGVLGALAPKKVKDIAAVIFLALVSGLLATLTSTAIAAMVIHDLDIFIT